MPEPVPMRPAYCWTCPECGIDQFEYAIVPEVSDEDLKELRDEHGVQPWETGYFQSFPQRVECQRCRTIYDTIPLDVEQ